MRFRSVSVVALFVLAATLANPVPGPSQGGERVPGFEVSENFVGVGPGLDQDATGAVVTWYSDGDGETRVLWANHPDLEMLDADGIALIPEFVGELAESERADIEGRFGPVVNDRFMPSAEAQVFPPLLCSMVVPNPWWDAQIDAAKSSSSQTCSNHLQQKLYGELRENTWWVFWGVRDWEDTGYVAGANVFVSMSKGCSNQGPKNWKNYAEGDAIGLDGQHKPGPHVATNWFALGCKS